MKKIVVFLGILVFISLVSANYFPQVYLIQLNYGNGKIELAGVDVVEGSVNEDFLNRSEEGYVARIVSHENESRENEVYWSYVFDFPREVSITPDEKCFVEEGIVDPGLCGLESTFYISNTSSVLVRLPFSPGAKYLQVLDSEGKQVLI